MKRLVALLLTATMIASLAACGGAKESETTDTATATTEQGESSEAAEDVDDTVYDIKVSGHPYIHALPSVYAIEQGYFKCEDPTVDMYSGGPVQNEAIASGAWDVGTTGTGGIVLGAVGYNLKAIGFTAPDENTVDLWVRPDSPLGKVYAGRDGCIREQRTTGRV